MPTDFRQYQDPGVYVEAAPFPTVPSGRISPTIVALVGDTQRFRTFSEVLRLSTSAPSLLTKEGIDRTTIKVANRLTGVEYTSSVVGRVTSDIAASGVGSTTLEVLATGTVPATNFDIKVDNERMTVTAVSGTSWTVTRGVSSTAAAHKAGAIVNLYASGQYSLAVQGGTDGLLGGADDTTTLGITSGASGLSNGDYVLVSYQYTDPDYYAIATLRNFDAVKDAYGAPFDDAGAINSELSLGALLAFKNGAERVVCVPVQAAGATPTANEFKTAIDRLNDERAVNVIVPLTGLNDVIDYAKAHCAAVAVQNVLRRAFVGMDGVSSNITATSIASKAIELRSMRVTLVAPTSLQIDSGASTPLKVGGQYLAAAVAGLHSSLAPQEPLTHKDVAGFYDFTNASAQDTLLMQQSGVTVLYKRRDGRMLIKHGLTTKTLREDPVYGNVYTQEISVITAQDRLNDLLEDMLANSALIGSVITDLTPAMVVATVQGGLEIAKGSRLIRSYQGLKHRFRSDDSTAIEVRFEYKPSLPLNYIQVVFSIDTTSGETSFSTVA